MAHKLDKRCCHCKVTKSVEDFCKDRSRKDGINILCKVCVYDNKMRWKLKYPMRSKRLEREQNARLSEYRWAYYMKKLYNLSVEDYRTLLKNQDNRCAICMAPQEVYSKRLAVDHSHITGKVRGLLCMVCNRNICGVLDKRAKSKYVQMSELEFVEHLYNYYKKAEEK